MTTAGLLADVDGDGDIDIVSAAARMSWKHFERKLGATYQETLDNGAFDHMDVFTTTEAKNRLYKNDGQGGFTLTTSAIETSSNSQALALGDVTGDGKPDLFIGNVGAANEYYENDGSSGVFSRDYGSGIDTASTYTWVLVLGDTNGDGWLDLIVGNVLGANEYYMNDGDGTFTRVTSSAILTTGNTRTLALADFSGDGYLDLAAGNDKSADELYVNDGSGNFMVVTDSPLNRLPVSAGGLGGTYGLAFADFTGDGWVDLVATTYARKEVGKMPSSFGVLLYINNGTGHLKAAPSDIADAMTRAVRSNTGLPHNTATGGLCVGDFDNDGDIDFLAGDIAAEMYINTGGGIFASSDPPGWTRTMAFAVADLNNDGFVDLWMGRDNTKDDAISFQYPVCGCQPTHAAAVSAHLTRVPRFSLSAATSRCQVPLYARRISN